MDKLIRNIWAIIEKSNRFWHLRILVFYKLSHVKMRLSANGRSNKSPKNDQKQCKLNALKSEA